MDWLGEKLLVKVVKHKHVSSVMEAELKKIRTIFCFIFLRKIFQHLISSFLDFVAWWICMKNEFMMNNCYTNLYIWKWHQLFCSFLNFKVKPASKLLAIKRALMSSVKSVKYPIRAHPWLHYRNEKRHAKAC